MRGPWALPPRTAPGALGIYVHFPYCPTKCGYCDFNAYRAPPGDAFGPYLEAVLAEIALAAEAEGIGGATVTSVYFGGGTPTLFSASALVRVLQAIRDRFRVVPGAEATVEANPGDLAPAALAELRQAGFTRLSVGAQTFSPRLLESLGRIHAPEDSERAVEAAFEAGFERVNLDLMYGLSGQGPGDIEASVGRAVGTGAGHVSAYALELEPKTAFHWRVRRGEMTLPDEAEVVAMGDAVREALGAAGLERYEVSNHARPGEASSHNVHTWRRGRYRGFGAGAHSFVGERRFWNVDPPGLYRRTLAAGRLPVGGEEDVSELAAGEWVYLALRLFRLESDRFLADFGIPLEEAFPKALRGALDGGWLERQTGGYRVPESRRWLLNRIASPFLDAAADATRRAEAVRRPRPAADRASGTVAAIDLDGAP